MVVFESYRPKALKIGLKWTKFRYSIPKINWTKKFLVVIEVVWRPIIKCRLLRRSRLRTHDAYLSPKISVIGILTNRKPIRKG